MTRYEELWNMHTELYSGGVEKEVLLDLLEMLMREEQCRMQAPPRYCDQCGTKHVIPEGAECLRKAEPIRIHPMDLFEVIQQKELEYRDYAQASVQGELADDITIDGRRYIQDETCERR